MLYEVAGPFEAKNQSHKRVSFEAVPATPQHLFPVAAAVALTRWVADLILISLARTLFIEIDFGSFVLRQPEQILPSEVLT